MSIIRKLEGLRLKGENKFNQHMNQLRELVDKLAWFGSRLEHHQLLQYLLRSLPKSLEGIPQIAIIQENLTLEKFEQSVLTEIERKKLVDLSNQHQEGLPKFRAANAYGPTFQTVRGSSSSFRNRHCTTRARGRGKYHRGRGYRRQFPSRNIGRQN